MINMINDVIVYNNCVDSTVGDIIKKKEKYPHLINNPQNASDVRRTKGSPYWSLSFIVKNECPLNIKREATGTCVLRRCVTTRSLSKKNGKQFAQCFSGGIVSKHR